MTDTGFNSNGKLAPATAGPEPSVFSTNPQTFNTPTGAFPNQLASVAIHPNNGRAYVVSTGASPNGPLRFNSNSQGLVSVFNTNTRTEVTSGQTGAPFRQTAPLNLNQGINHLPPGSRIFMSNPVAMAWRPDGSDAWVVVQNSDLIARLTVDGNGIPTIGNPLAAGGMNSQVRVDLASVGANQIPGEAPRGMVINNAGTKAYTSNYISRSVSVINITDATNPSIEATVNSSALPTPGSDEATAHLGAALFFTGRGPQDRMSSEGWGGCIICHPNGRSDNVTWMFEAGPRQTISLDGMFNKSNPNDQRVLNWSAVRDENHDFELNTRGVFGGRGLIDDDRLFYAIGGANGATPTDATLIEQYQNFTHAITTTNDLANSAPLPTLLGERRDFGVATLDDDRVFILGGRNGAGQGTLVGAMDAVLEFNPRTNTLVRRNSTGFTRRHSLGAAAVKTSGGTRIYAVGGYTSTSGTALPTNTVEEYNPATDTWRTVASLPSAVAQFGIAVAGGTNMAEAQQQIHVVSGNTDFESTGFAQNSVQRFLADPTGPGVWSIFTVTGLTPRRNHGVAVAQRGVPSRVFIIGGQNNAGTVLNTVEEYIASLVTPVLSAHTNLPAPRAKFGIGSTLTTNQIYVMGGVDENGVDRREVFEYTTNANPAAPGTPGPKGTPSGDWVTRGNLSVARRGLGVTTPPGVTNFLPAKSKGRDARQDAIAVWIARKVRAAKPPVSSGGTAPHTFSLDGGALPPGLSLSPTGVISGTPTAAGTANFTVRATDANGCIGMQSYSLAVVCPTITITPTTLSNGVAGLAYNQPLAANGGTAPHNFTLNGGALPNGFTLSPGGVLAGTPSATGVFNFVVKATDQNGCMGTQSYTLTINCDTITVNPATLPPGRVNQAYPATLFTATGGFGPHTFNLTGTLPAGMTFANATLGGTPTQTGSFPLSVTATDAANCTGTRNYVLLVGGRGVKADFEGDGETDLSVWRGPETNWLVINSSNNQLQTVSWGTSNPPFNDVLVPGDYDGDGKADIAMWRPPNGTWFVKRSSNGTNLIQQHGQNGNTPVPSR